MIQLLFLVCMLAIPSIAHHDPRCASPDVQICVDTELDQSSRLNLLCVDSRSEIPLKTNVQWLKDGALHIMDSTGRIRKQGARLIFESVLISDEGNWTCSNGSLSPPFKLFAGKVNYSTELATLNGTVGNNFSIPCNIELGVNTAQTGYRVTISRRIYYNDRNNTFPLLNYRNNIDPEILSVSSTAMDPTSYRFYSSNLTLYVENFSVPSPQDVRGVKFTCEFYVANQGTAIFATTKTAVILGFHPPEIERSLENVTVVRQDSSYSFTVEVYSHPSPSRYWWQLNGDEIGIANSSHFVIERLLISGNTSTFILTLVNANEKHNGILQFTAKLGNTTASTQTILIIPPRVEKMQLLNSCSHIAHADSLDINLILSSALPEFSQPFTDPLLIQLQLNLSLIPKIPSQGTDSMTHKVNISDEFLSQWRGGRSIKLQVNRTAVLGKAMSRIGIRGERFRAQVKLVFNGETAAEWSPVCESPIFQPCFDMTSAEIKLKLKFSLKTQCSTHSANEVKREIEHLLRQKFSCDNITVQSANEYHCSQDDRVIFLKANVSTYYAKDRVERFYSYLRTEKLSILNGTVELFEPPDDSTAEQSSDTMVYLYAFIVLVVLCVVVFFIIATVLVIRKRSKKPKDPENEDGSRPPSSASSSRSQNFYIEDRSFSRSPMSPTSISSSVLTHTPNHTHNHAPHSVHTPPHSSHSSHSLQDHNSHYPEEPSAQGIPLHPGISHHQVIDLEDNTTAIPIHCVQYLPNQGPHIASTGGHETTTRTFLSEQEIRGNQQSRAESSAFGDDNMSLNDSEHRLRFMDSPVMRSTPSSGYQSSYHSSSRQSSSLSRYHHQKAPRQRHNTEGGHVHPVTALVQLPTTAGGGYLVLHGLDLADRQRTSSASQLQPPTVVQASNVIQVQPAAMSLTDMQQRTCEMNLPRSREHLRLPLPGEAVHTSRELRTVIPCEVMSPHRRLSDPSPLSGSPREICNLGRRGEEFSRQNTSGAESNSSEESIN